MDRGFAPFVRYPRSPLLETHRPPDYEKLAAEAAASDGNKSGDEPVYRVLPKPSFNSIGTSPSQSPVFSFQSSGFSPTFASNGAATGDDYRPGMRNLHEIPPPKIKIDEPHAPRTRSYSTGLISRRLLYTAQARTCCRVAVDISTDI